MHKPFGRNIRLEFGVTALARFNEPATSRVKSLLIKVADRV
jgi:hypothetical protein